MKHLKVTHKLAAVITASVLMTDSFAVRAEDFNTTSNNILKASANFPKLVSAVAYIGGLGLAVAGIHKLKQHVDQPAQHPMKDGLIRLGAGGGLLALPWLTSAMTGSVGNATGATPAAMNVTLGL